MKILELLCEPISNGGQEAFVMNVYNNIDMTDLQIDLFTPYYCDNDYYKKQVNAKGGKIYTRGLEFNPGGLKFNIIAPIRAIIRKNKYDVVHIHTGSVLSMACAAFAAKLEHVKKIIVHSHSTADVHTFKRDLIKKIATPVINKSATDFFACSKDAGEWKFSKKICNTKLKVIKNGINLERFSFNEKTRNNIREKLNIDEDTLLLGHVGRFCYEKNQEFLIELVKTLSEEDKNVKLLLVGTGETLESIKELAVKYRIADKVIFQGNVDNVYDYMQAMDVFLFPSKFEGLGIVAVEAQAAGLPVIASDAIAKDVKVSDNIVFESITNRGKWIKRIEKYNDKPRFVSAQQIKRCGYDVKTTSKEIRDIYTDAKAG